MSTDQPSSSASSRLSSTGGRWRKPVSLSAAGTPRCTSGGFGGVVPPGGTATRCTSGGFGGVVPPGGTATGTGAAAVFLAWAFFVPAWPSSRYGSTRVRFTFFAQVVAAIDTLPPARPNCASIAAWLEGISPYCHLVALRGLISKVSRPATPNSSTRLAVWKAPQT